MYIAHVIPLKKGIPFDSVSYYASDNLVPGTLVKIDLNHRALTGMVMRSESVLDAKASIRQAPFRLKKITAILGASARYAHVITALHEVHALTQAPYGSILGAALSPLVGDIRAELFLEADTKTESQNKERRNTPKPFLCSGTSKERFETYRTLMRTTLAKGHSIIFVTPTNFDADTLFTFLSKGIKQKVDLLTSAVPVATAKQRIETWFETNIARVVVLTVPFLVLMPANTATVVIEQESNDFYKSSDRFHIDMRLFIRAFVDASKRALGIGDSIPRFATLELLDGAPLHIPYVKRVQIVAPADKKTETLFPESVALLIQHAVSEKKPIWIMAHRRGVAPMSRCKDCGALVRCITCGMPMVLRRGATVRETIYNCQHCGRTESASTPCRVCASWNIFPQRIGSDAIVEYLARLVPDATLITHDMLQKKMSAKKKVAEPVVSRIYIGTEAMLPYLGEIEYAIIPFFDRIYATPSYETSEHLIRTIVDAHECARKEVVIVSGQEQNDILQALKRGTLRAFIASELETRQTLHFPPFGTLLRITITGRANEWPALATTTETIFSQLELSATALGLIQVSGSTLQLEKSWIVHTSDAWLREHGDTLIHAFEAYAIRYAVERNPHYFG